MKSAYTNTKIICLTEHTNRRVTRFECTYCSGLTRYIKSNRQSYSTSRQHHGTSRRSQLRGTRTLDPRWRSSLPNSQWLPTLLWQLYQHHRPYDAPVVERRNHRTTRDESRPIFKNIRPHTTAQMQNKTTAMQIIELQVSCVFID